MAACHAYIFEISQQTAQAPRSCLQIAACNFLFPGADTSASSPIFRSLRRRRFLRARCSVQFRATCKLFVLVGSAELYYVTGSTSIGLLQLKQSLSILANISAHVFLVFPYCLSFFGEDIFRKKIDVNKLILNAIFS